MINNDIFDCDEWIAESREKRVGLATFLMALAYALYAVLNLYVVSEPMLWVADPWRLLFTALTFLIISIFSYRHSIRQLVYVGLIILPIAVAISSMVMMQGENSVPFYLLEMGILIVWIFIVCGLRFQQSLTISLMVLVITFYSLLIYHAHYENSSLFYLFLLVVLAMLSLIGSHLIEKLTVDICIKTQENQELSMTDELTELPIRAKFDFVINSELERSRRYKYKFGLLMIEIDNFKPICKKFGKEVKKDLLIVVASMITDQVRSTDIEIRWSEHEFVVVCLELDIVQLRKIANSILQSMRDYDFGRLGQVTLSIGATINKVSDNDTSIVNRAKQALFKAKHDKSNSVESL